MFGLQWCFGLKNRAAMAPKRCYDAGRLGEAAGKAAKRLQKLFGSGLVCEYSGVVGGGNLTRRAMVQFSWRVAGSAEEHTAQVRCAEACARGVPLPGELKEAYCRHRLEELVKESETEARELCGVGTNLTCRSLCSDILAYAYAYIS